MLGTRGVRLGIRLPELTRMQARALFEAAARCVEDGVVVEVEVMVPLVSHAAELRLQQREVEAAVRAVMEERGVTIPYKLGTMIEVPRAALTADEIAATAQFFSFGTNDLTQTTFGFSRDDIGKFLGAYQDRKILERDPFASLDTSGVGQLVAMGTTKGRATKPALKVGVCGEHGGDPASIHFFGEVGLDYVSCSPFRVPIARLAAAQAALRASAGGPKASD